MNGVVRDFLYDLELSVRTERILRAARLGLDAAGFMSLRREEVLRLSGAGAKTWAEIRDLQEGMRPKSVEAEKAARLQKVVLMCRELSTEMCWMDDRFRLVLVGSGRGVRVASVFDLDLDEGRSG